MFSFVRVTLVMVSFYSNRTVTVTLDKSNKMKNLNNRLDKVEDRVSALEDKINKIENDKDIN